MLTDKEAKKKYRNEFYENPEKYYATEYLKGQGFSRSQCKKCSKPFWSTTKSDVCGDPACGTIPFGFIGSTPAKKKLGYIEVWKKFAAMFRKFGYTSIKRYPIVSRWNPTMEYTNASIASFQPFVISGEVEPPAKRLVIPQFCFRTVDIDNVGITGSHNTVFSMIGQHQFVPPKEWDQNLALEHIHTWLKRGLGLPNEEITFHEDAWAGGGNLGPCMEFFSRGCELGNQVYMMYEQTQSEDASGVSRSGINPLSLKVLDMGMGQERNAWFSQGTNTQYDATFPTVVDYIIKETGLKPDRDLQQRYVPYGGLLNLDEIEDVNKAWETVANKIGTHANDLKKNMLPLAGAYSVAEHSRTLLIMFNDGAIPSNVGDSYNLRIIFRRMMGFIDKYGWDIDVYTLFEKHAKYLKPQCPELARNLGNVAKIFDVEKEKYEKSRENVKQIVKREVFVLGKSKLGVSKIAGFDIDKLIELYDSHGVQPEQVSKAAKEELGITIDVPDNFFNLVSERHGYQEQKHQTKKILDINLSEVPATKSLYWDDYKKFSNTGTIQKIKEKFVVMDESVAYPTSGGQLHDTGRIGGEEFVDVVKQGPHVVHVMKDHPTLKEQQRVKVEIDEARRIQLAKHHTATHILNAAARIVLGAHSNQASAFKDVDKAHLDVTHYRSITEEELDKIEKEANKIVRKNIHIEKKFIPRGEAEARFGFGIYQGPAVPGKELRIVNILKTDVEACGGTHLDSTGETGKIIILSTERIQDNISRITFVAGPAAEAYEAKTREIMNEVREILNVKDDKIPEEVEKLLEIARKERKAEEKEVQEKAHNITEHLEDQIVNGILVAEVKNADMRVLQNISRTLSNEERTIVLFGTTDKIYIFVAAGVKSRNDAGEIIKKACQELGGRGGGTRLLAQGVATDRDRLSETISHLKKILH